MVRTMSISNFICTLKVIQHGTDNISDGVLSIMNVVCVCVCVCSLNAMIKRRLHHLSIGACFVVYILLDVKQCPQKGKEEGETNSLNHCNITTV